MISVFIIIMWPTVADEVEWDRKGYNSYFTEINAEIQSDLGG